jgi:hypothetical protein
MEREDAIHRSDGVDALMIEATHLWEMSEVLLNSVNRYVQALHHRPLFEKRASKAVMPSREETKTRPSVK